jgi:hypothetical protein
MKTTITAIKAAIATLAFLSFTYSSNAEAQTCRFINVPSDPDGHVKWRINGNTSAISELTTDQILVAGALATNTWNDNANGITFQFAGTSSRTTLPNKSIDCASAGIDFNLLTVEGCSVTAGYSEGTLAVAEPKCISAGKPTKYHIRVFGSGGATCTDRTYGVGFPGSAIDLVALLTHEFGHAIGLDHSGTPCSDDGDCSSGNTCGGSPGRCGGSQTLVSTMAPLAFGSRGRDLYTYDIKCANEVSTIRERTPKARTITSGTWTSEITPDFDLIPSADVALGFTSLGGGTTIALTSVQSNCVAWRKNTLSSDPIECTGADNLLGIGPSNIRWTEFSADDRVVFSETSQVDNALTLANSSSNAVSKHRIRYRRSGNGFQTGASGSLSACTSFTSFMQCSSTAPIASGEATSSALLPGNFGPSFPNGVTVFAWTNQQRDSLFSQDQMVKIAVGMVGTTVLPTPTDLGVRSTVAPGVACNPDAPFDCIVAYVDPTDSSAQVRIKRFNITTEALRFGISAEGGFHEIDTNVGTAARVAVLFNDRPPFSFNDRYWIVIRALRTNEPLEAFSSANGATWTQDTSFSGTSHVGPSSSGNSTASTTGVIYVR